MKIEKVIETFIQCPNCGKEETQLISGDGRAICYKCNYVFAKEGENVPKEMWKEKDVDAIRCDKCNELIPLIPDNMRTYEKPAPVLLCPHRSYCNDSEDKFVMHAIAIHYEKHWFPPAYFLTKESEDSINEATDLRDKITLYILNTRAMSEDTESAFRDVSDDIYTSKIFWLDNKAIGYYTYTKPSEYENVPVLRQVFVEKEYRRKGYATKMLKDFLMLFPEGDVTIDSPSRAFLKLLLKEKEVRVNEKREVESTGRLRFRRPRM